MTNNTESSSESGESISTTSATAVDRDDDGDDAGSDDGLGLDIRRHGGNVWFFDDFPCMGPAFNELPEADKNMVIWATSRRSVTVRDVTYYVYCRNMASWWQMESPTAAQELSEVAGINAPVNYAAALRRFYPLLSRLAFPLRPIKNSICVGTYRLKFRVNFTADGPIVDYSPHETVIDNDRGPEHRRMYMFVTSPIIMSFPFECPVREVPDLEGDVINSILLPLRDDQKLDFLWRMGRALTDPIENPSVIIFWGPTGEEGKSVLALNISRIFGTGAKWTVTDLIGKTSKWPDPETVMELAEKRLIVCDECDIEDDMNYNNIKRWTSNAPVQSKGVSAYLSQTIIGITNKLGFSKSGSINNSIGRRVIVYRMNKRLGKLKPFPKEAITNAIRLQFIGLALSVSNCYVRAPVSLEIALETEFKKSVNHITAGMIIDPSATVFECRTATALMATRAGVPIDRLVGTFAARSARLVCEPKYGMPFIVGIKTIKFTLTATGRGYVASNWGKSTIDLENLKANVKII